MIILINGEERDSLKIAERIFHFGDGLFETCRLENHKILFWDLHLQRLKRGALRLGISPIDENLWRQDVRLAISRSGLAAGFVKLIFSRGQSILGYRFAAENPPLRTVIAGELSKPVRDFYRLTFCRSGYAKNPALAGIKHCNRLENILAAQTMTRDECLMMDENGAIISATSANVFIVRDRILLTPDLENCGIAGTRREVVIDIAKNLRLPVSVKKITRKMLLSADEIFLTNAIIGVRPVVRVDSAIFKNHAITQKIQAAYEILKRQNAAALC